MAEARGLLKGDNLSEVQSLALEYLRFMDGLDRSRQERRLVESIVRGALVSSGNYDEKILFPEHFPESATETSQSDADTVFDLSAVDYQPPDESEIELLAAMLSDSDITISGGDLGAPGAKTELRPPKDFDPADVEHDSEWV